MRQSRMVKSGTHNGSDEAAGGVAIAIHQLVSQTAMLSVMKAEHLVQGIVIASHAATAAVHVLAKVVGKDANDKPLTPTQVLFAALLTYHACPYELDKGHSLSEFSPIIMVDALRDFEKLTGRRPDDELIETMCETCREFVSDPSKVAAMQAERAKAMGEARGGSLN